MSLAHAAAAILLLAAFAARADAPEIQRGAYLAAIAACSSCHTPSGSAGRPGAALSGGRRFGRGENSVAAANLTPDRETGLGAWSDSQIATAIHDGVRPDGSRIEPPMPQVAYRALREDDLHAIVAYLRSVPAVHNVIASRHRKVVSSGVTAPATIEGRDPVANGRYLANAVMHCTECHTPGLRTAPDFADHLDQGGRIFPTADGLLVAPAITPDALRRYSDVELGAIITDGKRPDGSRLKGPMPVAGYAHVSQSDLRDLIAYLRRPARLCGSCSSQ